MGAMMGRGPRARRGNVRAAILTLLAEGPRNGYQMMQDLESRSGGQWRPSSGSIYPTLQQLEDEGLVEIDGATQGQSRSYKLTKAGTKYVDEHKAELAAEDPTRADEARGAQTDARWQLMGLFRETGQAAMQVARNGSEAQVAEAKKLLVELRKKLYGILAAGDDGTDDDE